MPSVRQLALCMAMNTTPLISLFSRTIGFNGAGNSRSLICTLSPTLKSACLLTLFYYIMQLQGLAPMNHDIRSKRAALCKCNQNEWSGFNLCSQIWRNRPLNYCTLFPSLVMASIQFHLRSRHRNVIFVDRTFNSDCEDMIGIELQFPLLYKI